jgi:hypothetical protein
LLEPHTIIVLTIRSLGCSPDGLSQPTLNTYRSGLQAPVQLQQDLAFFIRGPMDGPLSRGRLKFFREAPRLGLTGISFITIGEHGVIAESVAYDLNLALAVHQRRAPTEQL